MRRVIQFSTGDDVRERHEVWVTPEPIKCVMMTVLAGRVAAVRFAVEGVRAGLPVITMEHVNRLTDAAAAHWPYPPDGRPGVHRATVAGDAGVEINAHVGVSGVDHNPRGQHDRTGVHLSQRPARRAGPACRAHPRCDVVIWTPWHP